MLNRLEIIGNTGSTPEMRFTPLGQPVTSFRLASNRRYTTSDGEKKEETEWFSVVCWGKLAESVNQYLEKGRQVYVAGRVRLNEWEGQDGQKRARMEINANTVLFLGPKPTGSEAPVEGEFSPDDIPF